MSMTLSRSEQFVTEPSEKLTKKFSPLPSPRWNVVRTKLKIMERIFIVVQFAPKKKPPTSGLDPLPHPQTEVEKANIPVDKVEKKNRNTLEQIRYIIRKGENIVGRLLHSPLYSEEGHKSRESQLNRIYKLQTYTRQKKVN